MNNTEIRDKIRGSLIGGAIGDALGYQIEFETAVEPRQVTRFEGGKGIISDDTQMTLFTACALLWRETRLSIRGIAMLPHEAIYLGYLDWLGTQQRTKPHDSVAWIRRLPGLNVMREPGMTCLDALSSGKMGTLEEPINDSKGCGGIMRLAPIPLYLRGEDNVGEFAAKSCAITHGHPLAILSAYTLGLIIYYVLNEHPLAESITKAIAKMQKWEPEVYRDNQKINLDWAEEKQELTELLENAMELSRKKTEDQAAIRNLGGGWVAEEALAIAIYCSLKHQDSFENAIIAAVNHDGDSDSTGAITGNILGASLGYAKIPDYFKDHIELKDNLLVIADDLAAGVPVDKNGEVSDQEWLEKYSYQQDNPRAK